METSDYPLQVLDFIKGVALFALVFLVAAGLLSLFLAIFLALCTYVPQLADAGESVRPLVNTLFLFILKNPVIDLILLSAGGFIVMYLGWTDSI